MTDPGPRVPPDPPGEANANSWWRQQLDEPGKGLQHRTRKPERAWAFKKQQGEISWRQRQWTDEGFSMGTSSSRSEPVRLVKKSAAGIYQPKYGGEECERVTLLMLRSRLSWVL